MTLLERFRRHLATLGLNPGKAVIAVSGGPDSVALLDLLARTVECHRLALIVAHLDHGIHPDSAAVAERVRALAAEYRLDVELGSVTLGPGAGETAGREARYVWLEDVRRRHHAEYAFTAHHADDQAETVLMRVLAGSGPAGLAGMSARSGPLVRPLLPFRRVELARYLEEAGLSAWLDPANADVRHLRSWLRTELLPAVRDRLPQVDARLVRVARDAGRNRAAWDALLTALPALDVREEPDGISVAATLLRRYDSPLSEALVAAAARRAGCPIGHARAARALGLLRGAASGAEVPLARGWKAELAFDRLRIVRGEAGLPPGRFTLSGGEGSASWGRWRVRWLREAAPSDQPRVGFTAWIDGDAPTVRGWSPGDRIRPLGGAGSRPVVRSFQEARVPRSLRARWPVVEAGGVVLWVPGVCRSDQLVPPEGTEALRVDAELA